MQEWLNQWDKAVMLPVPEVGHLFIGGPLHGQRAITEGTSKYYYKVAITSQAFGMSVKDTSYNETYPTIGYDICAYVMRKVMIPTGTVWVYALDTLTNHEFELEFGKYLTDFFSEKENTVNTPVPPLPKPSKPVQISDGLRITIGGQTIEWTPDESQLAGLLSWAAQSLGPGKDVK